MPDFKPSQVVLAIPPLCGTMGHAEKEFAAAIIVRCCQAKGDKWQPVSPQMFEEVVKEDLDAKTEPFHSLNRNPYFRPSFRELAESKYGRWVAEGGPGCPIELTEEGIEALRRWVKP
jgi:hypothetical protein